MENAAQALKMAAWVLIFVAALSITMNAFSQARQGIDTVLTYTDREYLTSYIPPSGDTQRTVGFESIIPAIYRSFKDNYTIVFPDYVLYYDDGVPVNSIDLSLNGIQDAYKEEFIKRIMYGNNGSSSLDDKAYTKSHFTNMDFTSENTKTGYKTDKGLSELIKDKQYKESIGVYYIEDQGNNTSSSVPDANKKEKRVITYIEL